jgi:glucose-1-phosphate adenylyltransferase
MDFAKMFACHIDRSADITIAVQPATMADGERFGILKRDKEMRITDFAEKPKDKKILQDFTSRSDPQKPLLASAGIYLFNVDALFELLESTNVDDFGGEVIPAAIHTHKVVGYDFEGFWEDIGTIRSFYDTNLALARPNPPFNLFDPERPIFSRPRYLPGSIISDCTMQNTLIAEGCCIDRSEISHSVIGLRSQVRAGAIIRDTIMMGSDYYENEDTLDHAAIPLGIGSDCQIQGGIIDKNARIGAGTVIKPFPPGTDLEEVNWVVRDGIVVIPKNTLLPPGTKIVP